MNMPPYLDKNYLPKYGISGLVQGSGEPIAFWLPQSWTKAAGLLEWETLCSVVLL